MNYKLIVSDLDGTLLTNDMKLSPENAEAIKKLTELGIEFAVSSGRTLYEVPSCIREFPYIRYIAYSNGTAIYDKMLGRDISSMRISRETVNKIFDVLSDYDVVCSIHVDGKACLEEGIVKDETWEKYQINDYYREILLEQERVASEEELARSSEGVEAVVMFFSNDSEIEPCRRRLEAIGGITVTSSVEHNLELCSRDAGKGRAFKTLMEHLDIKKEETVAVGDNMNDTSMFAEAGFALCAKNGSEGAKALADKVICSFDEHTAKYIYEMLTI